MHHLPFHTAHTWLTHLSQLTPPIPLDQIPTIATELGWEPTNLPDEYLYPHGSDAPRILIHDNDGPQTLYAASFSLARNLADDLAGNLTICDLYTTYIAAATTTWGPPTDLSTDHTHTIWKLHEHAYINIHMWARSISCNFDTIDPNLG
ncbi:MAG: DUF6301 family protein [Propionibacteriaceae bacterium]|nr:DUF6301 family protein [Propionibacteriaceae bacterium]